jgi:hypothetical protein
MCYINCVVTLSVLLTLGQGHTLGSNHAEWVVLYNTLKQNNLYLNIPCESTTYFNGDFELSLSITGGVIDSAIHFQYNHSHEQVLELSHRTLKHPLRSGVVLCGTEVLDSLLGLPQKHHYYPWLLLCQNLHLRFRLLNFIGDHCDSIYHRSAISLPDDLLFIDSISQTEGYDPINNVNVGSQIELAMFRLRNMMIHPRKIETLHLNFEVEVYKMGFMYQLSLLFGSLLNELTKLRMISDHDELSSLIKIVERLSLDLYGMAT